MAESQTPSAPSSDGKSLPPRANLEHLKKQAKRRLTLLRRHDARAKLTDAQRAVATQYGFKSWRAMKEHVDALKPVELDVDVLKAFGQAIYRDGGDVGAVGRMLDERPQLVNSRPWAPHWLHTPMEAVAGMCVWHRPKMRQIARMLIERGAACNLPTLARCGLVEEVQRHLDATPQALNERDENGRTALYRATCVYGSFEEGEAVSRLLIERGATVDICSAATLGMVERVRELLAADPSLAKAYDGDGMTALHWAVRQRRSHADQAVTIARLLLDAGAEVEAVNRQEDGMHPLHHCGEWMSTPETAEVLLEYGADINAKAEKSGWTPLDYAVDRNRKPMIAFFTKHGGMRAPRPDDEQRQFLKTIADGDVGGVKQMLNAKPELVNEPGPHPLWGGTPQPLHVAIDTNRAELFTLLLERGADIDGKQATYDNWSPLLLTLERKCGEMRDELLRRGASISLPEALMLGDDDRVEAILRDDPQALQKTMPSLASPLRFARTVRAIDMLVERGAPLDLTDRYGGTPMSVIAGLGANAAALVRRLIEHGASGSPLVLAQLGELRRLQQHAKGDRESIARLHRVGGLQTTLLHAAVEAGHTPIVRWLLKQGSPVNMVDSKGVTPLHAAAWQGRLPIVKLLVDAGADVHARDGEHDATPAQWSRHNLQMHGRTACLKTAEYLEKWMKTHRPKKVSKKSVANDWKPIMDAAFAGNAHLLEQCLKAGADPNVLSPTNHRHRPLHRAIERKKTSPRGDGHEAVVRALLAGGADPKLRGTHGQHTALQLAAIDSPRFVPLLADRFKPLDFWHACVMLDEKRATILLKKDASLASTRDENQWSPLHYVAASGLFATDARAAKTQVKMAGMLLDAGADINGTYDYQGGWPIPVLYYACGYHNNPTLTAYLLERGAIPYDNESVYHASDEGHAECLAIIEKHADAGKLAVECTMCLQTQMHWGGTRGAKWLLEHGADPNALHPKFGQSALHAAARNGASAAVITLLLKHGGDPRSKNREGLTAIEVARKAGKQRVIEQLQAASKSKKK